MNLFDFVNDIMYDKKDLLKEEQGKEEEYNPFLTNRALSYHPDTVLYAYEMNIRSYISKREQYSFLLFTVRSKKRFSKWYKSEQDEDLKFLQDHYQCSTLKTKEFLKVLTKEQIEIMKEDHFEGEFVKIKK